jgi:predicted PurR-regulated permease PerM
VRGQIVICLILAVFYAGALRLTGLNHAVLIGLTAGLISFVPYLGLGVGFVVAACVAIAQFWPDWTPLAVVAGIFLLGETIADYVLSPRIIGSRVKLNPVWLMFALFAFGYLFGFVGLLVAIPLAASLGVILRFAMRKSLAGPNIVPVPVASGVPAPKPVAPGRGEIGQAAEEIPRSAHHEAVTARPGIQPKAS